MLFCILYWKKLVYLLQFYAAWDPALIGYLKMVALLANYTSRNTILDHFGWTCSKCALYNVEQLHDGSLKSSKIDWYPPSLNDDNP